MCDRKNQNASSSSRSTSSSELSPYSVKNAATEAQKHILSGLWAKVMRNRRLEEVDKIIAVVVMDLAVDNFLNF